MSRSFGVRSLTIVSPIRISPSLISSSPASMRSAVDLPHPDGPDEHHQLAVPDREVEVADGLRTVVVELRDVRVLDLRHARASFRGELTPVRAPANARPRRRSRATPARDVGRAGECRDRTARLASAECRRWESNPHSPKGTGF